MKVDYQNKVGVTSVNTTETINKLDSSKNFNYGKEIDKARNRKDTVSLSNEAKLLESIQLKEDSIKSGVDALEAVSQYSRDGDTMMRIEDKGDTVIEVAAKNSEK